MASMECPKNKIALVIGKGGATIKALQRDTQCNIQINQEVEPCVIIITGPGSVQDAKRRIKAIINGTSAHGSGSMVGYGGAGAPELYAMPPRKNGQKSNTELMTAGLHAGLQGLVLGPRMGHSEVGKLEQKFTAADGSTQTRVMEKKKRTTNLKKTVVLVIDVSPSMRGSRLSTAMQGAKMIFDEVLSPQDRFMFIAFNNVTYIVQDLAPKSSVNWEGIERGAQAACGGATSLWRATNEAFTRLGNAKIRKDVHINLVVMTDGQDNDCERELQYATLKQHMLKPGMPNFHAMFLSCGRECDTEKMRGLIGPGSNHVKVFHETEATPEAIKRAFGRAKKEMVSIQTDTIKKGNKEITLTVKDVTDPHGAGTSTRICTHYKKGYCRRGDKCNFAHPSP